MEQLNHAEEGLCISPPASSQTLLPAGLALAVTCCQLALLPAAEHHWELTPSHWSHFRHSSLLCLRADDGERHRNKFSSSLACLHSGSLRPALSQPQDCLCTICSVLQPKWPVRERGDESAAPGAWFRMEATFSRSSHSGFSFKCRNSPLHMNLCFHMSWHPEQHTCSN